MKEPLKYRLPSWREVVLVIIVAMGVAVVMGIMSAQGAVATGTLLQQQENQTRIFLNSVALLVIAGILTFAAALFWWQKNQAVKEKEKLAVGHQSVVDELKEMQIAMAGIRAAVVPISAAYQAILIKELTHFHTPEMDELMEKIPSDSLTPEEEDRLFNVLLPQREKDMGPLISETERDAAHILPVIVKRARAEAAKVALAEKLKLKLVTVTAVIGVPIAQ